jgi:hypothetical protein
MTDLTKPSTVMSAGTGEASESALFPAPLPPELLANLKKLYKLYYKRGFDPHCELVFAFDGDLASAIKRGREHCLRMNYKFIHVKPYFIDLDESEKNFTGGYVPPPRPSLTR